MKTRSRKPTASGSKVKHDDTPMPKVQQLEPSVTNPPKLFIQPKDTSPDARIITLPNPGNLRPGRYLADPEHGFYEYTRVCGKKDAARSWLVAPDSSHEHGVVSQEASTAGDGAGYVLQSPDLFVATPIDPLFLVLPVLSQRDGGKDWGSLYDRLFLEEAETTYAHLQNVLRADGEHRLEKMLEQKMQSVCEVRQMSAEDDAYCSLADQKLAKVIYEKALKMVKIGLPASMEEHFVKEALVAPEVSIKREDSSMSMVEDMTLGAEDENAAITVSSMPANDADLAKTGEISRLLRLRTALNYLLANYVPPKLREHLQSMYSDPKKCKLVDFKPLDERLSHINKLKSEAQALRSISDNISRKRGALDDEEALEKNDAKKRKKEEEDLKKKNTSHGVKRLMKADTSGMKKMSSFFTKAPAKK